MSITLSPDEAEALRINPPPATWRASYSTNHFSWPHFEAWWRSARPDEDLEFACQFLLHWQPGSPSYQLESLRTTWSALRKFGGLVDAASGDRIEAMLDGLELNEVDYVDVGRSTDDEILISEFALLHQYLQGHLAAHYAAFLLDLEGWTDDPSAHPEELRTLNQAAVKAMQDGRPVFFTVYGDEIFIGTAAEQHVARPLQGALVADTGRHGRGQASPFRGRLPAVQQGE